MRTSTVMRRATVVLAGIAAICGIWLTGSASASTIAAAPGYAISMPCGYDGYPSHASEPFYTHCGQGSVQIKVNHFFWQTTYFCAVPGRQQIPQGSSSWSIIGAEYDGVSC